MKTFAERVIAALARHERAAAELGQIKKGIGAELEKCQITIEAYKKCSVGNFSDGYTSQEDYNRLWEESRVRHHLHQVLQLTWNDGGEHDRERKLDAWEIRSELSGDGEDPDLYQCPHCLAAWALIERRKEVRSEFGIAKRALRALGKTALKVVS
ncbi:MAG: hypothetical protein RR740_08985 [Pseudomonas sp.]